MSLGVLSVHLDAAPCAVGCSFCYLGGRAEVVALGRRSAVRGGVEALVRAAETLDYAELAVALNEAPGGIADADRAALVRLVAAAAARGRPVAVTATAAMVAAAPEVLDGVSRLNLSVDPWKLPGPTDEGWAALVGAVDRAARTARGRGCAVIAIATLSTPGFAAALVEGLLAELVDLASLDGVALNALKPPPPFCDRAFWLDALARLRPLLDRAIDRRLHLDCYVAARLLGIGGCPARPDLSPTAAGTLAFRACVYAARPDVEVADVDALGARLAGFAPPAVCPFDTRL